MSTNVEKLPKQARRQLEQVAEIEASLAAPAEPAAEAPAEPEAPPAAQPAPAAPAEPEPDWKQKFLTLQGIVNANNKERDTLAGQLAVANAKLEALTNQPAPEQPKPEPHQPLLTKDDVEAFGPELIDMIKRAAKEVAADLINSVHAELEKVRAMVRDVDTKLGGVAEQQGDDKRRIYFSELEKVVPDWRATNEDPAFIEWLKDVDPLSGLPRQAYLNNAWSTFNVSQTAALFNAWKPAAPTTPAPQTEPAAPVNPLERQVQPNSSRAAPAEQPNPNAPRSFTQTEVRAFYADVAKGKYRGRDAERIALEQQIDAAAAAGRVR